MFNPDDHEAIHLWNSSGQRSNRPEFVRTAASLDSATGMAVADTLDSDPEESECEAEVVMDTEL